MKWARKLVWLMTYTARQNYGKGTIKSIRVTPKQHNIYTPPMAHPWAGVGMLRVVLGEACKCLFIGGYKDS